jgi:hypothetical protein
VHRRHTLLAALATGAVASACAGPLAVSNQAVEDAYVERRPAKPLCRSDDAECCALGVKDARAAAARGESHPAARLWHEVAVTCPTRRSEVAAAVQSPSSTPPAGPPLNVSYRFSLPPAVRLYWVAASAGQRLLPGGSPTGDDQLHVEVHAIRFDGKRPGPLMRMELVLEPPREPGSSLTIDVSETSEKKFALVPRVQIDRPAPALARPAAPVAPPRPAPDLEKARIVRLNSPRLPTELGPALKGTRRSVRVCLDREGSVDTIRFLEPTHPRLAGSLADSLRDARWEPYRINSRAVPSCEVVELQF